MNENTNIAAAIATEAGIGVAGVSTSFVVFNAVKSLLPYAIAANPSTRVLAMIGTSAISLVATDAVGRTIRNQIAAIGQSIDEGKKSRKTKKNY